MNHSETPSTKRSLPTPVIALSAVAAILLVAVPLIVLLKGEGKARRSPAAHPAARQDEDERKQQPGKLDGPSGLDGPRPRTGEPAGPGVESGPKGVTVEQVEKIAAQFMRRISSDDRPYVFPPYALDALGDIAKRVERYSASPALAAALGSIAAGGPALAAEARREGLEPGLVIYAALAETEGGQASGDQIATARRIMPELLSLRKTLGTESADKSLILVAAYRMGGWTKKSHPLLATMRRVVKNPLTDRNVWYLREHGGLDEQAYDFVVRFVALGAIAENPRRFGVAAQPVAF